MIKRKICSVEGCNLFVWKGGLCQKHIPSSHFRFSSEKKNSMLKKFSEAGKKKREEKVVKTKELHEFMFEWWQNLSSEQKKYCWSCGARMPSGFSTAYCDHLLEKGVDKYKHLAFEPKNLWYCCLDCHANKGNGFPTEKHKEAIENAKKTLIFENN